MTKKTKLWIAAAAVLILVVASALATVLFQHHSEKVKDDAVAVTVPLALQAKGTPKEAKIGVVLTLGDAAAEGSEWNKAAQGIRVAQHRYDLGGTAVDVVTANDHGTDVGSRQAVQDLAGQKVSGIILATSGNHTRSGLDTAAAENIPVIAPYAPVSGHQNQWSLTATDTQATDAFKQAFGSVRKTVMIDAGGTPVADGLPIAQTVKYSPADDPAPLARRIAASVNTTDQNRQPVDSLLISGSAQNQAKLVKALQAAKVTVPIGLGPEATSPVFAQTLKDLDGSVSANLITVGPDSDDAAALQPDGHGRAMSAFLNGVRVLAENDQAKNLTDDQAFSKVADLADSRSHDALVALVQAISEAHSTDSGRVATALSALKLQSSDGVAGAGLDFSSGPNPSTDTVGVLRASTQQLGLRPGGVGAQSLIWFSQTAK